MGAYYIEISKTKMNLAFGFIPIYIPSPLGFTYLASSQLHHPTGALDGWMTGAPFRLQVFITFGTF
jgi:hypothetical protein